MDTGNDKQLTPAEIRALIDWYLAFRQAAAREHAKAAEIVAGLDMDQSAVPVMIPVCPGIPEIKETTALADCFGLFQELVLHEFTRLTAIDPDNPDTNEIAIAQIQLALRYFAVQSFAEVAGDPEVKP